jgi:hypothetical protein
MRRGKVYPMYSVECKYYVAIVPKYGIELVSLSNGMNEYRVGGGITSAVLPHHRAYGSVHGGSHWLLKTVKLVE